MSQEKPLPVITALDRPFWDLAATRKLGVQVCQVCKHVHFPGSPVCPACLSSEQEWQASTGTGLLQSWATFHRAYWPAFEADLPYTIGMVELTEGPLFAITLVEFEHDELALGLPVEVVFGDVDNGIALPKFRPVRGQGA
jgi:uncharacterized OB-fold protein